MDDFPENFIVETGFQTPPPPDNIQIVAPDGRACIIDFSGSSVIVKGNLPLDFASALFFEHVFKRKAVNLQWVDVEDYIRRELYYDAGVSIASIIKEIQPNMNETDIETILEAINGEL